MIKEATKFQESTIFEGMTSIRSIIKANEQNTNDRKIEAILFDKSKIKKIGKDIGYLRAVSEKFGFTINESTTEEIEKIAIGTSHGGIIATAGKRTIPRLCTSSIPDGDGFYCMIQGIEDPYNFGYSLRSLYACGCSGIILPERNWMSAAGVVARSSAGASELFEMFLSEPDEAVDLFKKKGFAAVCAHEKTDNILGCCELKFPLFLIVGGEKRGISKSIIDAADILVKINYAKGFNASLSAASATTMFAYEISRQNRK